VPELRLTFTRLREINRLVAQNFRPAVFMNSNRACLAFHCFTAIARTGEPRACRITKPDEFDEPAALAADAWVPPSGTAFDSTAPAAHACSRFKRVRA
jgi:hypothetical protein